MINPDDVSNSPKLTLDCQQHGLRSHSLTHLFLLKCTEIARLIYQNRTNSRIINRCQWPSLSTERSAGDISHMYRLLGRERRWFSGYSGYQLVTEV